MCAFYLAGIDESAVQLKNNISVYIMSCVIVDSLKYKALIKEFLSERHKIVYKDEDKNKNIINYRIPELHFKDKNSYAEDNIQLLVNLINKYNCKIICIAFENDKTFCDCMSKMKNKAYSYIFSELCWVIQEWANIEDNFGNIFITPIIDAGFSKKLSTPVYGESAIKLCENNAQFHVAMNNYGKKDSLSGMFCLSECVFADSKSSILIQFADFCANLCNKKIKQKFFKETSSSFNDILIEKFEQINADNFVYLCMKKIVEINDNEWIIEQNKLY